MRYNANPFYWDRQNVRSKTIEAIDIEYRNTAFMLYEQNLVDMMMDLVMDYTPDLVQQTQTGQRNDIHTMPSFGTYYLVCNCRERFNDGQPNPLADPRVRRALSHAVNRQALVDHVVRLGNPVATTYIPRDQIPNYESPQGLPYNPDLARRELADAGYPQGRGMPVIEYLYNTGANQEPVAQAIERMWETELGIQVQLVGKETKTFADDLTAHRFMVARSGWFGDYVDPTTFLDLCQSQNGHNTAGFNDTRYDNLLADAAQCRDPQKRLAILSQAETYLVERQLPVIPLYTYVMVYAWRPNITGLHPNPRNWFPTQYIGKTKPADKNTTLTSIESPVGGSS